MRGAIFAALLLSLTACSGGGAAVPSSEPAASEPAPQPTATPADPDPNRHPPAIPMPAGLLPSEPGEQGARAFVAAFLKARDEGDAARARDFLSPTALEQAAGASLTDASGWEIVSFAAADANSYEVQVRGTRGSGAVNETLFVGPGTDASGAARVWIVRGIERGGPQS